MLILGILLILFGMFLLLVPAPWPNKDPVGWFVAFIGVVLVVVVLVLANCTGAHC